MVERSGNIDNIFNEGLRNYSKRPPEHVWENISSQLNTASKRRIIPVILSVAASIVLIVGVGLALRYFIINDNPNITTDTNLANNQTNKQKTEAPVIKENITAQELGDSKENIKSQSKTELTEQDHIYYSENLNTTAEDNENTIQAYAVTSEETTQNTFFVYPELNSKESIYSDPIASTNPLSVSKIKSLTNVNQVNDETPVFYEPDGMKKDKKWAVGGEAGPMYTYRELNSDYISSRTESRLNSAESGLLAYAGGVNVKLKASRRFSVQTGVYYSKIGQYKNEIYTEQTDMYYLATSSQSKDNSYVIVNSTGTIPSRTKKPLPPGSSSSPDDPDTYGEALVVNEPVNYTEEVNYKAKQYFEYIEIPLYVKFKVIDKKIDFKLIGGISTNILIDNNVVLDQDGNDVNYGPTEDINYVNYSSTFGLGIEYPFAGNFSFNLEPVIKYYLNPINKNADVDVYPYSIGILSGISYNF